MRLCHVSEAEYESIVAILPFGLDRAAAQLSERCRCRCSILPPEAVAEDFPRLPIGQTLAPRTLIVTQAAAGGIAGTLACLIDEPSVARLMRAVVPAKPGEDDIMVFYPTVVTEIGNILLNGLAHCLADLVDERIRTGLPELVLASDREEWLNDTGDLPFPVVLQANGTSIPLKLVFRTSPDGWAVLRKALMRFVGTLQ